MNNLKDTLNEKLASISADEEGHGYAYGGGGLIALILIVLLIIWLL